MHLGLLESWIFRAASCILHAAVLLSSGCNIAGALAYKVVGPPEVQAEYKPPQEPLLVLVENFQNPGQLQSVSDELASAITQEIVANKAAPTIDPGLVVNYRSEHPSEYKKMRIPEIGKAVGARQIVYVDLQRCDVTSVPGADTLSGHIAAKVRVVDADTGATRWPNTGDGQPFNASTDYIRRDAADTGLTMRNQMVNDLSVAVGRLFYKYKPDSQAVPD